MKLSDNLKSIRKENNLSQEQLAEKIGVSRQAVSKWESGQSYPEMDKVLLICKLFNYNIDELMNENVKQVDENKQSKINFNKYIEDFFDFITKTVDMLSCMNFKQKLKCLFEQCLIIMFLVCVFAVIGAIVFEIISKLLIVFPVTVSDIIINILEVIYIVLALIVGITVFLHIFKIRYLDYYEIVREDGLNKDKENINVEKKKYDEKGDSDKKLFEKEKEKIVIRDPEHSQSKFLTGIMKIVLWCIKIFVAWLGLCAIFTFISLVILLVLSFLFVKTGLLFVGGFLTILAVIIINFIVLKLFYDFIVSKKSSKYRMAILFVISLIMAGVGIGMLLISLTNFNYIDILDMNDGILEDTYSIEMSDNLSISYWNNDRIEFVESDLQDINIVVKHSKYNEIDFLCNEKETVQIYFSEIDSKVMDSIRRTIKDINNKEFINYYDLKIYVYGSKDNIEKMKKNQEKKYEESKDKQIDRLYEENERLEEKVDYLKEKINEKDAVIEELTSQN